MAEFNFSVNGGDSIRLKTAGKYCDRDIVVTGSGGSGGGKRINWYVNSEKLLALPHIEGIGYRIADVCDKSELERSVLMQGTSACAEFSTEGGTIIEVDGVTALALPSATGSELVLVLALVPDDVAELVGGLGGLYVAEDHAVAQHSGAKYSFIYGLEAINY